MPIIKEITDTPAAELDIFANHKEPQLKHYFEPDMGVFITESPKVIERALNDGYEPIALLMQRRDIDGEAREAAARCGDIPLYTGECDTITDLIGFKLTRGALCAMRRRELPSAESICKNARRIAVLENVVNPTNIGAIFRSAAALNFDAVLLTDGCSDPLYRRASRVSMGTVFQIPWTFISSPDWTAKLKEMGFATAALALKEDSVCIDDAKLMSEAKLAVVLGTEGDGLAASTIADCDYTVLIPMSHGVDSLNVAAASAVAFWQLGRR